METSPALDASPDIYNGSFSAMRAEYASACPQHPYKTRIFSQDPLIIYIEDYLSQAETNYLLDLA
jgi:prolyl 4-hydroxylase